MALNIDQIINKQNPSPFSLCSDEQGVKVYQITTSTPQIETAASIMKEIITMGVSYSGDLNNFKIDVLKKPYLLYKENQLQLISHVPYHHQTFNNQRTTNFNADTHIREYHAQAGTINIYKAHVPVETKSKEEFVKSLKEYYLQKEEIPLLIDGKKLPIETIYTSLAIITEEEKEEKNKELKENTSQKKPDLRIPTYESIFKPKKAIRLEDIFNHEKLKNKDQKKIVVQGSAGIGKSTLCHHASYKWAQGNLWPEFNTIFWIKFRNLTKDKYPQSKDCTLYEMIARECGFKIEECKHLLSNPEFRKGSLLILDGYDELPDSNLKFVVPGKGSLPVLEAFQKEFPHILITTRPQKVDKFEKNTEMEILGFEQEAIEKYIDRFFPDNKQEEKTLLKEHLENPLVNSLSHIPINLEIFSSLAYEGKLSSSKTLSTVTSIYQTLTEWLIQRFGTDKLNLSFKDLKGKNLDIKQFSEIVLQEIAWKMMEDNQLIIKDTQIGEIIRSKATTTTNEIEIKQIGPLRIDGDEGHFIHLTFQEFFAAKYLARLFSDKKINEAKDIIAEKKFHPRYRLVMWMTAGLLKDLEHTESFFDSLHSKPRDEAQSMELILLAQCFEEGTERTNLQSVDTPRGMGTYYSTFIDNATYYLQDPLIPDHLKHDLLNRNYKTLHEKKITQIFLQKLENKEKSFISILSNLVQEKNVLPQQLIQGLVEVLKSPQGDEDAKRSAARALGEVAKGGSAQAPEAIQGLVEFLKSPQGDRYAKRSAAAALGEVAKGGSAQAPEAIQGLVEFLKSPQGDEDAKSSAAYALGKVAKGGSAQAPEAIQGLVEFLKSPQGDEDAKSSAAKALREVAKGGSAQAPEAIQGLVEVLKSPQGDQDAKSSAAKALREVAKGGSAQAPEAIQGLVEFLKSPQGDRYAKRSAAEALGEVAKGGSAQAPEAIQGLVEFLKSPQGDEDAKRSAAEALREVTKGGNALPPEAIQGLVEFLKSPQGDRYAKRSAALALGEVAKGGSALPPEAIQGLVEFLKSPQGDRYAKSSAAAALGEVAKGGSAQAPEAIQGLVEFLKSPQGDEDAKSSAALALGEVAKGGSALPPEAIQGLVEFLKSPQGDRYAKSSVAVALGEVAKGGSALHAKRSAAEAEALGKVAKGGSALPPEAIQRLVEFLKSPQSDQYAKRSAAEALGEVAKGGSALPPEAIQGLVEFLKSPQGDRYAKRSAAEALGEVAKGGSALPPEAIQGLVEFLKSPQGDEDAKRSAAEALREVTKGGNALPPEAIQGLVEFLKSPQGDEDAKRSAAEALREVTKGGNALPPEAIQGLVEFLKSPQSDQYAKRSAAEALGEVAKGGSALPPEAIQGLVEFLKSPQGDEDAKRSAAYALGEVAKGGSAQAPEAIQGLVEVLKSPQGDGYAKSSAAEALGEVAKGGSAQAPEAIQGLVEVLKSPQDDGDAKSSAAKALGEVAKGGSVLPPEAIQGLVEFLKDPKGDGYAKSFIYEMLNHLNLQHYQINAKTALELLLIVCKLSGKAIYQNNGIYYIANQRELFPVKQHEQFTIQLFREAIKDGKIEQLTNLCDQNPKLLTECCNDQWTPFHIAAYNNQLEVLQWLYEKKGQFLQNCCVSKSQLFHIAAFGDYVDIGKWLLDQFPDLLNCLDTSGKTPYTVAKLNGKTGFANWIASKGGKENLSSCVVM